MRLSQAIWASAVRVGFLLHGLAALFGLVYTTQISTYWFIGTTMILLMIEVVITYRLSPGEWKWFVPSAFIYLCTVVPVIWLLEIASMNFRIDVKDRLGVTRCPIDFSAYLRDDRRNITLLVSDNLTGVEQTLTDARELYSTTLQQTTMLILILGRWLQPRGELSRDQLSQLLLVYIGMAADMLEFSTETLRIEETACIPSIFITVLTVWTWSLTQFTLGLTATSKRKSRPTGGNLDKNKTVQMVHQSPSVESMILKNRSLTGIRIKIRLFSHGICGTELWAVLTSVLVQDGPYLVTRLYIIFHFHIYDRSMLFFTCKNALLLFLMSYRLFVVLHEAEKKNKSKLIILQDRTQPAGNSRQDSPRRPQAGDISDHRRSRSRNNSSLLDSSMLDIDIPNKNLNQAVQILPMKENDAYIGYQNKAYNGKQEDAFNEEDTESGVFKEVYVVTADTHEEFDNDFPPKSPPAPPPLPPPVVSSPSISSRGSGRQPIPPPVFPRYRRDHMIYAEIPRKPVPTPNISK